MTSPEAFNAEAGPVELAIDAAAVVAHLSAECRSAVSRLRRRGAVVAVSGGVDSGVTAALCANGLGPERVFCLRLPERDSSDESADLGLELAKTLGTPTAEQSITASLEALDCYERAEAAVHQVFPEYERNWPYKLVRSPPGGIIVFSLVVERPDGTQERRRMPHDAYRELLAAVNMKQRVRKLFEYTWADRLGYAVAGTPNLLEYDQGFFVKGGDGLADFKPIAGLYKSHVYALARELKLPPAIASRPPTTDTFSLQQGQDEFYFGYPHELMDLLFWGNSEGVSPEDLSPRAGLDPDAIRVAYEEIDRRRVATEYLHAPAIVPDPPD
jgi:NAD+ synthase